MTLFISIYIFILGLLIGSFLNVVILRYNTGRGVDGRSGCMHCGYKLRWFDLIPVFSWLFLRGRCRKCSSKISIQYPLVELGTAVLFLGIFLKFQPYAIEPIFLNLIFIWNAVIASILMIIFVYDIYHKIIPNELSYTFAALAFLQTLYLFPIHQEIQTIDWLNLGSGLIMFLPFWALWAYSKGSWIGLGDGKLALGIGWYLGFIHSISAIVLAFWIGAIFSVAFLLIDKLKSSSENITMKTEIPFAPFLIIGLLIEFFWQLDVVGLGLFFMN